MRWRASTPPIRPARGRCCRRCARRCHPLAQALALEGRHADGATRAQVRWFCRGERIYQATVIGRTLDARAAETFFGSLKLAG
ncbi:hypothetical protein ABXN37_20775 [Piscinibacter sakaiensis]|uniref:hypothetical protein n=1 Tax=Piscinibacter sakaiensis TaxID=1547922 RepID=UPI00372BD470